MARGRVVETDGAGNEIDNDGGSTGIPHVNPSDIEQSVSGDGSGSGTGRDGEGNDSGTARKRGRPRGTGTGSTKTAKALDLSSLTGLLIGFHAIVAVKVPEMELQESEAKQLQTAMENVSRHYPIKTTQKAIDIAALVGAVGWIYGTRIVAIGKRNKDAKNKAPKTLAEVAPQPTWGGENVTGFRQ